MTSSSSPRTVAVPAADASRRRWMRTGAVVVGTGVVAAGAWVLTARPPTGPFASLDRAYRTLEGLRSQPAVRATEGWDLARVLHHAAQSIEFSITGFPEMKGALFRATAGAAAFSVFGHLHKMRHDLEAPIPGAPAIEAGQPLGPALDRVLAALRRFEQHRGPLAPHFAYGDLSRDEYLTAHLLHLDNHWDRVTG